MLSRALLCVFSVLLVSGEVLHAQSRSAQGYRQVLVQKHKAFVDYANEFLDFAKSGGEEQILGQLAAEANDTSERIGAASTLLEIYDGLACPSDRSAVLEVIQREFSYYKKQTEVGIKHANLEIAYAKKPGTAAEAIHMRDDLRELEDFFDSVRLQ